MFETSPSFETTRLSATEPEVGNEALPSLRSRTCETLSCSHSRFHNIERLPHPDSQISDPALGPRDSREPD